MLTFHSIAKRNTTQFYVWKNQLQNKAFNYNNSYLISLYPTLSLNFFLYVSTNQFREVETIKKHKKK